MTIECQICKKEFEKQITNSHLKSHNISTQEYKIKFGSDSLTSAEYKKQLSLQRTGENNPNYKNTWTIAQKQQMSDVKRGTIPWNKGKTYSPSDKMLKSIQQREKKYRLGKLKRLAHALDEETKEKISKAMIEYANNNSKELSIRANKAIQTKKKKGYDLAFFKGKKHTDKSIQKIKEASKRNNIERTKKSHARIMENINKANLSFVSWDENNYNITLKCNTCSHVFTRTKQIFTESKFLSNCCPVCFPFIQPKRSKNEKEIFDFVKSLDSSAIANIKISNSKKEIDIFVPNANLAIEYNGLYWHSEQVLLGIGKNKTDDNEKRKLLSSQGIRYIGIFEDEWENKKEIVKNRLLNILNKNNTIIYARKCSIKEVSAKDASTFCEMNHIQGRGKSNIRYGLYHKDELVSLMTFTNNNLSRKVKEWEINRFCSKLNITVVGGASKLFKHFIKEIKPEKVISYSDNRWDTGNLYKTLGFEFSHETTPNYWYIEDNIIKRIHRFSLRKRKHEIQTMTEMQLRDSQGYKRIWDCGSAKWMWEEK